MPVKQESIYLALGANLASPAGAPAETLRAALNQLSEKGAAIRAVSAFYSTPAYPAGNGPDFVNAAASISADWSPRETLDIFHAVEADLGRTRSTRWGQRTLDLDLIAFGDTVLPDPETHARWRNLPPDQQGSLAPDELILPHPRLQDRAFVLVPLADIAPDWVHPVLGQSVRKMCAALDPADVAAVKRLE
ncbi:2-amino-4-hydroxy-6-hydroxymethyldihydropteridine diphosphokinase [Marimonas sp. MJW-29]|uniref:2-amino-4-hydroxy-6-hydroxymethyldihydropteridine pyrophosphokinase n=1 Tax=Sulfitobacter sediminis TaxID=3234186 RepID=A0ABV3RI72_9RHOB